jgi:hypothetical protein
VRFSVEIYRDSPDGSAEIIHRMTIYALTPKRIKSVAADQLKIWAPRGATRVVIHNPSKQKLYEWRVGEEPP